MTPLLLAVLLLAEEPTPALETREAKVAFAVNLLESGQSRKEATAALVERNVGKNEAAAVVELAAVECACVKEPEGPTVTVLAGGTVVLGSGDTPTDITPLGSIAVDWTLAGQKHPLVAHVDADFTGLPDAEITFTDARDFNALEMSFGASIRPLEAVSASVYCEGGFASRFASGLVDPKTSAPLWSSCGLWFTDKGDSKARLRIGVGADERLGYGWTFATHVKGSIQLVGFGADDRYGVTVLVRAILGMETPAGQKQRINQINAGIGMSWGN